MSNDLLIGLAVVAGLGALGFWAYRKAKKRAWIRYNKWDIRSEGLLKVGDRAPEIALASVDGSGPRKLADLHATKPLVLVFGSYT